MKLPTVSALLLGALVCAAGASPAHADILSLRVEAHGGGGAGTGVGGARQDEAFFDGAKGGAYGALVGLEALFVDVWVQHHQYVAGDPISTWTQFMTGLDLDFELRADPKPGSDEPGRQTGYLEAGIGLGFGVGTGQQVELPLDAGELSDRAFLVEVKLGAGLTFGRGVFGVGISVPVSAGYFFKSGFANNEDNHYYGAQGAVMLVVRGKIKLK